MYITEKENISNDSLLTEHCINAIREFIMCKADMTPIVLVPPEKAGVPVPVPEFRTKHVCRNFEEISKWVRRERTANLPEEESLEIAKRIRERTGTRY
jgi:mycotoxin biosynthesis protein UstYa